MDWKTMLTYISGSVEELLLRNEYLVAENPVLRNQTQGCCARPMANGLSRPSSESVCSDQLHPVRAQRCAPMNGLAVAPFYHREAV